MKTRQTMFAYVIASLLLAATASAFAVDSAQTYSGRLNGGQFFCAGTPVQTPVISGVWTVSIDPNTPAQVTLNVFYDGRHHLAFGYNALMLFSYSGGIYVFSGFGDSATAVLDTNVSPATFSWHVELGGGCPPTHPYDSLTFLGVANR
jgi:hypothetical protein